MKRTSLFYIITLSLSLSLIVAGRVSVYAATGTQGMVVTADGRATDAALEILKQGGNAVDAAVAAQWVLNVVEPGSSGIGGGGFFVYYDAENGQAYSFDGREKAPAAAEPDMFLDSSGEPYPFLERATGGLPVGVPGTLMLLHTVHDRFASGKFEFSALFEPAIKFAEKGAEISPRLAKFIAEQRDRLVRFDSSRKIFLDSDGRPRKAGDKLYQKDLAKTFERIQESGISVFYKGIIAQDIVAAVRHADFHPGLMTLEDMAAYEVIERPLIRGTYRGYEIASMGPPSSGGMTLMEALNILEGLKFQPWYEDMFSLQMFSRAQQISFQDRNRYMGDSDFVSIPSEKLLSKAYAQTHSEVIGASVDTPVASTPKVMPKEGMHTSHMSIVDQWGNVVSFTTTIEHVFGSALVAEGTGVLLNNELTDFEATARLDSGELKANAPAGNKRPRSSMTPTIVFHENKPLLAVGSPGGSRIIGTVLNVIVNVLDHEMDLAEALNAPRLVNRDGPAEIELERLLDGPLKTVLEATRKAYKRVDAIGNVQAIYLDPKTGTLTGESDPRGEGVALGY